MGLEVMNIGSYLHRQPGATETEYNFHHHHGNENINDNSPIFGQSHAVAIKAAAAQSQAAFDAACEAAVGVSWYRGRPLAWKQGQRSTWAALP